jgi:hypothetical protein
VLVAEGRQGPDEVRHSGLVVDDRDTVRAALAAAGIEPDGGRGRDVAGTGPRVEI